jgi:hypothetical protein
MVSLLECVDTIPPMLPYYQKYLTYSKMHYCNDCLEVFDRKRQLTQHAATVHNWKGYVCDKCDKRFARSDNLHQHQKLHDDCDIKDTDTPSPPPELLERLNDEVAEIYRLNWHRIKTKQMLSNAVMDQYNFRIDDMRMKSLKQLLEQVFSAQKCAFKIHMAFGWVMHNYRTFEYRYYYASNNTRFPECPIMVSKHADLKDLYYELDSNDVMENIAQQKPSSVWSLVCVTNMIVYVYKLPMVPLNIV